MKKFLVLILFSAIIIQSCKESDRDEDKTIYTSTDVAFSTNLVYDIFKIVYQSAYISQGIVSNADTNSISLFGCDTISKDTLSTPKWNQIKFNPGCSVNGTTRGGSLKSTYNGYFDVAGTTATIGLSDYLYNAYKVYSGSITIKNEGVTDSIPTFTIQFNEVKIINNFNQRIYYSGTHQLKIIQGQFTQSISDDVYAITGNNSGRVFKGNGFSSQIVTALNLSGNCAWIGSGIVTVKPDNKPTRTLDFGSGCDNKISVTIYDVKQDTEIP